MQKTLVTGANGFVGFNLAETLAADGRNVVGLVRHHARAERLKPLGVAVERFHGLDDLDGLRRAVAGVDVVYHVAGATKALSAASFFQSNERGTCNVARVCAEQPRPPVLVFVSSLAACGPSSANRARRETDLPCPICHYGRSKRAAELALRIFADRVPITIVRPPIILGPADVDGLALFQSVRRFRIHAAPAGGHARFSIIHVADLCRLLILAAEQGARIGPEENDAASRARGCYFASCGEDPTYAELGGLLREAVDRRVVVRLPVPMPVVWSTAAAVEALSRVIHHPFYLNLDKAREIAAGSWTCSPRAAITELGFAPAATLAQRLGETAAWYRTAGWMR